MLSILGLRARNLILTVILILSLETLFRLGFYGWFHHLANHPSSSDTLWAFYLGLKFDLRVALALSLPLFLWPRPFNTPTKNKWWAVVYAAIVTILIAVFLVDFGYFAYLHSRLNASVLGFLENFWISAEMVWQTYPILPSVFLLVGAFAFFYLVFRRLIFRDLAIVYFPIKKRIFGGLTGLIIIAALGHGKLSQYPLRWSEAFFTTDAFTSSLGINPVHYFFDTLHHREKDFDIGKVKKFYPLVAKYFGVEKLDNQNLNFARPIHLTPLPNVLKDKPNVVFIIMESFASYKTGFLGHPMNPTPYFDKIAKNALTFTRFYVPAEGTARSVFCYVSGVPDVTGNKTSSRNPLIVEQNTIVNAFTDYDKFYFIGGSANWGNIRGVLAHNISGVDIVEEGQFHHPRTDVWGIADLHLFEEANERLVQHGTKKPFFAFIQTAGFHRPYTIPSDHGDFAVENLTLEQLAHSGFISNDEYNSMRFADYSLGRFFELAKKSAYFGNTIFVVVGDHGLPDDGADHVTPFEKEHLLSRFHVPLTLYSPKYWPQGSINTEIATSPDVLPSLAGLMGRNFENGAFGRNLFDPQFKDSRFALSYIYYQNPPGIGLLTPQFFSSGDARGVTHLYATRNAPASQDVAKKFPKDFENLKNLNEGLFETAKYLLYHNPSRLNSQAADATK